MKTPLFRFTLYAIIVYLTGFTLTPAIAASQPSAENGTHFCGVIDYQPRFHRSWTLGTEASKQPDNRRYARTFAANLNVGEPYTVRLIYFLPNDRQPQPDIDTKMNALIKEVQQFYADQMENHGFGRKTFRIETDVTGKAVVHHVNGKFNDAYYQKSSGVLWGEINEQFDTSKNFYLMALDTSSERINNQWCGIGIGGSYAGSALLPASGHCFSIYMTAHELGHAFGLQHDNRANGKWIPSSYTSDPMVTSFCAAEWLDAHRAFNTVQHPLNKDKPTTIQMLPPSLASPPNAVRFRFEVTDADGLHQAQLHTPETELFVLGGFLACKRLNGTSSTVEFVTTELTPKSDSVLLQFIVIDMNGNFSGSAYLIDVPSLLPPSEVVSIPDANLAAAVQHQIGGSITTHTMLNLRGLDIPNRQITDLTGLEHAHNLRELNLGGERVSGEGYVNSNAVSNFSSLEGLTHLTTLYLGGSSLSDISALAGLTQLRTLNLYNTSLSDISALAGLTQLRTLNLGINSLSDVSALAGLPQLRTLYLGANSLSDISALAGLTQLNWLDLSGNAISDVSALAGLTQLTYLRLYSNSISDVSALAGLTQLKWLGLGWNAISDVSPLLALNLTGTSWDSAGVSWDSTGLYLEVNPLSYASIHTHIPAMQAKGIEVRFDPRTHRALLKISGDNQKGVSFAPLSNPFVVEAQDENGSLLEGISVTFDVTAGGGTLSVTSTITDENGRAQSTLTLGPNLGTNTVEVSATGIEVTAIFNAIANSESPLIPADVNDDGSVNILDLVSVASEFGSEKPKLAADVNGDGIINILDLILVAGMFEGAAAGPAAHPQVSEALTAVEVQGWLTDASSLEAKDPIMKRGFLILKQLLASLTPTETELLANYPNPFNPETWMPYRLAEDAFVTLTIYDGAGQVVRTLDVGHQITAVYENRSKAIYWDGRNGLGEQVASGVYFYHLSAGSYSATRKMLILK